MKRETKYKSSRMCNWCLLTTSNAKPAKILTQNIKLQRRFHLDNILQLLQKIFYLLACYDFSSAVAQLIKSYNRNR